MKPTLPGEKREKKGDAALFRTRRIWLRWATALEYGTGDLSSKKCYNGDLHIGLEGEKGFGE
jgi:hypothetical protein